MQGTRLYPHSGIDPGQTLVSRLPFVHRKTEPKNHNMYYYNDHNIIKLQKYLYNND